jgi:hypothetical protein
MPSKNFNIKKTFTLICSSFLLIFTFYFFSPVYCQESGLDENWGTRPYEEEVKSFWIVRQNLLKKNHQLQSSYMQSKNSLDAYMAEWSESKREEAEQWFKTSNYYPRQLASNLEYLEAEYDKNKNLWDELAADVAKLPREQWGSYIKFLREEQELFNLRVTYYSNKLQAMKTHSTDWAEEFVIDCLEDYYIVLEEVITSLPDELMNCFKDALTGVLKNLTTQSITGELDDFDEYKVSVGDSIVSCIKDLPLTSICNALNAALKRQFIKEMKENSIDELVAAYWWDSVIQGEEKKPILAEAIDELMSAEFWTMELTGDKIKEWAAETAIPEIKQEAQRIYQQEYKKRILDQGLEGTDAAKEFREKYKKFVQKIAEDKTEDHIYNEYFEAASFAYDYLKTGYVSLISGRGKFDRIAEKLYAKYRHIKKCLGKKGEEPTPEKMLSIFEKSEEEFNKWFKENCAEDKKDALDEALSKCENIYNSMTAINDEALALSPQGDSACNSAEEKITETWGFLDRQNNPEVDILSETIFTNLHSSMQEKVNTLKALVKESNDAYVAAGLYKRYCENAALDVCQNAQTMKNIMLSQNSNMVDLNPNMAQNKKPSDVLIAATKASSEAEKNGDLALENIKKAEGNAAAALKLKDEIVEAVTKYRDKATKGREELLKAQQDARESLSDAKGFLSSLNSVIKSLWGKETALTQKWTDVRQILKPWATDEKAKGILERIRTIRDNLATLINSLASCAKSAEEDIKKLDKAMAEQANGIDERTFRENQDKLNNLEKLAVTYYNEIWRNAENAKSERSAVESAMNNAELCLDKAQEFLDKISEAQNRPDSDGATDRPADEGVAGHSGDFSTAGGETTTTDSREDCNKLHKELTREMIDNKNYEKAESILSRSKHCDWYSAEAGYLHYLKVCIPLTKAYDEAIKKKDWALAKSLHRKDPRCWIEGEDFDEDSLGRDEDSGFSTSGGETDVTETQRPEPQRDNCSELQNNFQAAMESGDLDWAQSVLNNARDCGFYYQASQTLQRVLNAIAEAQRQREAEAQRQRERDRNPQPEGGGQPVDFEKCKNDVCPECANSIVLLGQAPDQRCQACLDRMRWLIDQECRGNSQISDNQRNGSQPPPVDVQDARQMDFTGSYLMIDPNRTYAQYHQFLRLNQDGTFNSEEWLNQRPTKQNGNWIYNESSQILSLKWDDTQWGPGGFFSGPVTGDTNDFTINGRWSDGKPAQCRFTRN